MEEIKVSLIIPVYNVEKYIRQCLESVINQTLKDIEIICINDGSTDNSLEILQEFSQKDKRIIVIDKKNEGVSTARNTGILAAQGKYICFIDSDDFIDSSMIEELYNEIEKTNSDVIDSDIFLYDNKTYETKERKNKEYSKIEKGLFLWRKYNVEVWNKIYKKRFLLDNNIFFEEDIIYEDDLFSIKILLSTNKIGHINKCLYYYRINRSGSTMTDVNIEKQLYSLKIIVNRIEKLQETIISDKFSFLMLKLLEIKYLSVINRINKEEIEKNKVRELEKEIENNWKKLSELEKEILKNFLRKRIVNEKFFYNINLINSFYWKNKIINFKGFRRIIIGKILKTFRN